MSDRVQLELKDLVLAVKDVTEWYDLGLQLSLPVYMLDTIKAERLPVQESMREMLNKWLLSDPEASWEKLASALDAIDKSAVAENIRRQFVRSNTSVVAVGTTRTVDAEDAKTRQAMARNILIKIKGDFSDLLIEVQSSLEERKVKARTVRTFFHHLFEGECSIPNVPDMDEIFESITSAKLWQFDHYGPLEVLAEKYLPEDDSARVKMAEYISQLSAYYTTTSIIDHLKASDQDDPEDDDRPISPKKYNRRYRKLTVKVKVDPSVKMEYVEKLWKSLMKEFNIPELTAVVDRIKKGSLSITWLVLPHIEKKIRATFFKSVDFFQRNNIIEIVLYGDDLRLPLYDEEWMKGSTPLYRASFAGNIEEVKAFLHKGTEDINQQNDNAIGETPLMGACFGSGDVNIARLLLEKGAVVDALDKDGGSALIAASGYGHTDVVKLLLEYKAGVNIKFNDDDDDEYTALIAACMFGNTDIVSLLLAHGAVVDHRDKEGGVSALMCASGVGSTETVKVLLQHGATPDLTSGDSDTALMLASEHGHTDTARALLEKGASVDLKDKDGCTALWDASSGNHPETVKVLLEFGAEVDLSFDSEDGGTALTVASRKGYTQTVKVLLSHGASVDHQDKDKGRTPLMLASKYGHADTARALLEKGATVDLKNNRGRTALWYASYFNHPETVKVLLEFVAEGDLPFDYEDGGTALTVASRKGHTQTVKVLLSHGAFVDYQDKHGQTPLHHASVGGHVDTVTVLLEKGAKVDLHNEDGWTALLLAAKQGKDKVVKTLLDHGGFVNMKSKSGLTALDIARAESHQAVCEVIEQHLNQGAKVEPQQTGGQEDSESQDQVGESGQDSKTELTESGLTASDVARAESHLNQGAKVEPQQTGDQKDSESQDQVGESGQDSKTELTEDQRSEVRSVSERLWYQLKRVFLREVMEKKERTGQLQGDPSPRITDQPKGRRSILNRFNWPGRRRRRQTQGQVVGTAPVPEHHQ